MLSWQSTPAAAPARPGLLKLELIESREGGI
jgi:hypothetical protein